MLNTNQSMKIILCGDWWALDYTWEAFYLAWGPNPYVEKQLMAQTPPKFTEIYDSKDWSANSEHYMGLSAIYWNSVHNFTNHAVCWAGLFIPLFESELSPKQSLLVFTRKTVP